MSNPITHEIQFNGAIITYEMAGMIASLQKDENADLVGLLSDIADLKRFLINLSGSDQDSAMILSHLSVLQSTEDTLYYLQTK